jgi:hypothetical protein
MWHHVIPRHEWRKRFGNLNGFNRLDNLVELTTEQHAQVHELLFELNGNQFDKIAFRAIRGMIGKEEANKQASSVANKGNKYNIGHKNALGSKRDEEWKVKYGKKVVPRIPKPYVNPFQGKTHTAEARAKTGAANAKTHRGSGNPNYGKRSSVEKRQKISESLKEYFRKKKLSPPGRAA